MLNRFDPFAKKQQEKKMLEKFKKTIGIYLEGF